MKNYKHSLAAFLAVVMIGSLVKVQGEDILNTKKETAQRINAAAAQQSIVIAEKEIDNTVMGAALITNEEEAMAVQNKLEEGILDKSSYRFGYVNITSGTLNLRQEPSEAANVIGQLSVVEQVEILEEAEGYYKVKTAKGEGYVIAGCITEDKEEAEYSAMSFDNYRQAVVSVSSVNVRKLPTTNSDIIKGLISGEKVVVLWGEGEFIRVAYGNEYDEGYVINTSIEFNGEWVSKTDFATVQKKVADQRAAAAAAAQARENAKKTAATASKTTQSATKASSKGQAIVNTAMKYLGVPYVWGGTSPKGFDCSGLVQYVCRQNGIRVNRVAADQRRNGVYVSRENLQAGDLVFFAKGGYIHHVGIYVGNGNMIHAPQTGDVVKISSINTSYRRQTYAGAVRLY